MPIAPCATAGSISSIGTGAVMRSCEPKPLQPGDRQHGRVRYAVLQLAQARLDVAAKADDARGRAGGCRTCACRRSEDVPTTAPAGRSSRLFVL